MIKSSTVRDYAIVAAIAAPVVLVAFTAYSPMSVAEHIGKFLHYVEFSRVYHTLKMCKWADSFEKGTHEKIAMEFTLYNVLEKPKSFAKCDQLKMIFDDE